MPISQSTRRRERPARGLDGQNIAADHIQLVYTYCYILMLCLMSNCLQLQKNKTDEDGNAVLKTLLTDCNAYSTTEIKPILV